MSRGHCLSDLTTFTGGQAQANLPLALPGTKLERLVDSFEATDFKVGVRLVCFAAH